MPPAATVTGMIKQDAPHCHAPIHPPAPVPTTVPHPGLPLTLIDGCFTAMVGGKPAAVLGSTSTPCMLPGCVPGGPGKVMLGGFTVLVGGKPAARVNDMTMHSSCVAPIPSPVGKVMPPGVPTVMIGG